MSSKQLYQLFQPSFKLVPYIEKYYIVQPGSISQILTEAAFPDGGIYMTFSLNGEVYDHSRDLVIKPKTLYLVGTMTHFHNEKIVTNGKLFGIHFKPACFSFFFDYPLHEMADEMIEFQQMMVPNTIHTESHLVTLVEKFLLSRLSISTPNANLQPVITEIYQTHGNIDIGQMSRKYFVTERKLERLFKKYTGVGPQAFSKIIRFDYALSKIQNRNPERSLLDIAYECGYYDHAHLTREIKKYSGFPPSKL